MAAARRATQPRDPTGSSPERAQLANVLVHVVDELPDGDGKVFWKGIVTVKKINGDCIDIHENLRRIADEENKVLHVSPHFWQYFVSGCCGKF